MNQYIDLHTHSVASDGSMTPAELVRHAKDIGLKGLALTDHDTINGIGEAINEAKKEAIDFIPGIEVGVRFDAGIEFGKEMHILGYFHEKNYLNLSSLLKILMEIREKRNYKIIKKLNEIGVPITWEDVVKQAYGEIISRGHFAKAMVMLGITETEQQAMKQYIDSVASAYVNEERLTPEVGIGEIIKAGGVPVLAHPVLLGISMESLDNLIGEKLKKFGLMGLEVFYTENSFEQTECLIAIAKKHELLMTGGSDFHGDNKEWSKIGVGRGNLKIEYSLFEQLQYETELRYFCTTTPKGE